jgi:glycerophosphoryl diester phosphodiesterase
MKLILPALSEFGVGVTVYPKNFIWQGHRGCRGIYPENTIEAMVKALDYPITTLEMDVVISKDRQVVVSHEPWMSPEICTHPEGKKINDKEYNIFQMSYEEIKKFDCAMKPHPRFPNQKKIQSL